MNDKINLHIEYHQYEITQYVQDLLNNLISKKFAKNTEAMKRNLYDANNILARWIISMINYRNEYNKSEKNIKRNIRDTGSPTLTCKYNPIYHKSKIEDPFNVKFISELVEKRIFTIEESIPLIAKILRNINNEIDRITGSIDRLYELMNNRKHTCVLERTFSYEQKIDDTKCTLSYGNFNTSFDITKADEGGIIQKSRREKLFDMLGPIHYLILSMRYASILDSGQQWGLSEEHLWDLNDNYCVNNVGFCSPFNFGVDYSLTRYCSLFPDIEAICGSIGSFFDVKLYEHQGNWVINPPYIEETMEKAAIHIHNNLDEVSKLKDRHLTIFFIIPAWNDSMVYQLLVNSKYKITQQFLKKGTYSFEDFNKNSNERKIIARFNCIYFVLSNNRKLLQKDSLKQLNESIKLKL